jgi:hypothetical protein
LVEIENSILDEVEAVIREEVKGKIGLVIK